MQLQRMRKSKPKETLTEIKAAILKAAALHGDDGKGKDGLLGYFQMLCRDRKDLAAKLLEKVLPPMVIGDVAKNLDDELIQNMSTQELRIEVGRLMRELAAAQELLRAVAKHPDVPSWLGSVINNLDAISKVD